MQTSYFPGQHSDEKVLYEARPHDLALYIRIFTIIITAIIVFFLSFLFTTITSYALFIGFVFALLIAIVGIFFTVTLHNKSVAYITDRRIVRFEAHNPLYTSNRSLAWDDTMKVKTYPPNLLWSFLNTGTLVVHARASTLSNTGDHIQKEVSGDDLELKDIWYYEDLGNYIEKIVYLYRKNDPELQTLRPFVPKPRGQRY